MAAEIFSKLSVLLALSNAQAAEAFKPILLANGVKSAISTESNNDALQRLGEGAFNMIVVDENFPTLGGYDFCRFLRLTNLSASISPIIFGLYNPDQQSVMKARDMGASKIVAMPLTGLSLITAVASTLKELKPIVQNTAYNGPDRRRPNTPPYQKTDRRKANANMVSIAQQRKVILGIV
ncbi:response regulator [Kordiimonas aquimaris]|uniref:response regulator n=1 Tax=Kordiimonas aquimaris TaxID=707591 RepID=UPI0021D3CEB8|nr:response regulator [Kordiimonas aquimaris]